MTIEERLTYLEGEIARLTKSDRYTFEKNLQLLDGRYIQVGTGTGTRIGTKATEKVSFYGVTPVVQAGAIIAPTNQGAAYNQAVANTLVDAVNALRLAVKNIGITA